MKKAALAQQRFGRWLVTGAAESRVTPGGSTKAYWRCICDCGITKEVRAEHLRLGRTDSCGCLKRELAAEQKFVHGGTGTALYDVWVQMIQRCENPKNKRYPDWGGRGIAVCDRWHDFALFREDMGEPPERTSIDRIDNDKNYMPGNCRWSTALEQAKNKRPYGSGAIAKGAAA